MSLTMLINPNVKTEQATAATAVSNIVSALKSASPKGPIRKEDVELQIVWAEVYVPNIPDSQGDFMTAETIREMAYNFLRNNYLSHVDTNHDNVLNGATVVESFIARENDPDFVAGAWVVGVHVPDETLWAKIKDGELNGFSFEGMGVKVPHDIEMEIPDELIVTTSEGADGHTHMFEVRFDENGQFKSGFTTPADDGHMHKVSMGTLTDEAGDPKHQHTFSFVEGILSVSVLEKLEGKAPHG